MAAFTNGEAPTQEPPTEGLKKTSPPNKTSEGLAAMNPFKIIGGKLIAKKDLTSSATDTPTQLQSEQRKSVGSMLNPLKIVKKIQDNVEMKLSILGKPFGHMVFRYTEVAVLGQGGFGKVIRVKSKKDPEGQQYACKIQNKSRIMSEGLQKLVLKEIQIMEMLASEERVVKMHDYFEGYQSIYIIMEICEGGDALHLIRDSIKEDGVFTELEAAKLIKEMLLGIKACHENGVIHRDIKPENFMLNHKGGMVKITDFGLSTTFQKGELVTDICGTPPFMAPEMWKGEPYGVKVDVWALGITLSLCLTGNFPFRGNSPEKIGRAVVNHQLDYLMAPWTLFSDCCLNFFKGLLKKDPKNRLSVDQALQHDWLNGGASSKNIADFVGQSIGGLMKRNQVQKTLLQALQKALTDEEIESIVRDFMATDTDGDGRISFEEIEKSLKKRKLGEYAEQLFLGSDENHDGYIDLEEFMRAMIYVREVKNQAHLDRIFECFDKDGDNMISQDEFVEALKDVEDPITLANVFNEIDSDLDGRITYDEFTDVYKRLF